MDRTGRGVAPRGVGFPVWVRQRGESECVVQQGLQRQVGQAVARTEQVECRLGAEHAWLAPSSHLRQHPAHLADGEQPADDPVLHELFEAPVPEHSRKIDDRPGDGRHRQPVDEGHVIRSQVLEPVPNDAIGRMTAGPVDDQRQSVSIQGMEAVDLPCGFEADHGGVAAVQGGDPESALQCVGVARIAVHVRRTTQPSTVGQSRRDLPWRRSDLRRVGPGEHTVAPGGEVRQSFFVQSHGCIQGSPPRRCHRGPVPRAATQRPPASAISGQIATASRTTRPEFRVDGRGVSSWADAGISGRGPDGGTAGCVRAADRR